MTKNAIAIRYRKQHPEFPTKKLARILYRDEPVLFHSVEDARTVLRTIENKIGGRTERTKDKSLFLDKHRPRNPYNLPKSEETDYRPFVLKGKRIGVLCDIHAPYHSIEALSAAITYLKDKQVDTILINGDMFDFHGLSKYMKDPRKKNFAYELDCGADIIKKLQDTLGAKVVLKLGNHDERYQHYLWMKAGEIADVEDFQLDNLLKKRVGNFDIVSDKRIVQAGGLNIVHGHEFPSGITSPVNIARGFYLRGKTSVMGGHHHRTSEHTEQDMNGKITTTWSVGCLSELHPAYMPLNSWNHGVAFVEIAGTEFNVENRRIHKGKIL